MENGFHALPEFLSKSLILRGWHGGGLTRVGSEAGLRNVRRILARGGQKPLDGGGQALTQ